MILTVSVIPALGNLRKQTDTSVLVKCDDTPPPPPPNSNPETPVLAPTRETDLRPFEPENKASLGWTELWKSVVSCEQLLPKYPAEALEPKTTSGD